MTTLHLSRDAPVVLVDSSYFMIHRIFATARWWAIRNAYRGKMSSQKSVISALLFDDQKFVSALEKHMRTDILKIQKQWGLIGRANKQVAPNNIIFCKDCSQASIWRMNVYPDYKKNRPTDETSNLACLKDVKVEPSVLGEFQQAYHPHLEADDVACLLFRQVRAIMGDKQKIILITGDHDYLQLKDAHSEIYGLPNKNLWEAGLNKGTTNITRKILMGDVSDNIPRIFGKRDIEIFMELKGEDERTAYLQKKGKMDDFVRNKTLMCWSQIPEQVVNSFNDKFMIDG